MPLGGGGKRPSDAGALLLGATDGEIRDDRSLRRRSAGNFGVDLGNGTNGEAGRSTAL
jgi:hypothetical protein